MLVWREFKMNYWLTQIAIDDYIEFLMGELKLMKCYPNSPSLEDQISSLTNFTQIVFDSCKVIIERKCDLLQELNKLSIEPVLTIEPTTSPKQLLLINPIIKIDIGSAKLDISVSKIEWNLIKT